MSEHANPHDDLSEIELLLQQSQELLKQNAELLIKIHQLLEKRGAAPSKPDARGSAEDEDEREFFMGL